MPSSTSRRVARRFLESNTPIVVVAHIDPKGVPWGWAFPHLHRMHLIPLTADIGGTALVWLEDGHGHRSFQIERNDSSADLEVLRDSVARSRDAIERSWLDWCSARGWLDCSTQDATITLYSGPSQIMRHLEEEAAVPEPVRLDENTNTAWVEAGVHRIIWRGADDGSDAEGAFEIKRSTTGSPRRLRRQPR